MDPLHFCKRETSVTTSSCESSCRDPPILHRVRGCRLVVKRIFRTQTILSSSPGMSVSQAAGARNGYSLLVRIDCTEQDGPVVCLCRR